MTISLGHVSVCATLSCVLVLGTMDRATAQDAAITHVLRAGHDVPWLGRRAPGTVDLLVRFHGSAPMHELLTLGNSGVTLLRVAGQPLVWRNWALVRADSRGVDTLRTLQSVRDVRVAPPPGLPPLDRSAGHLALEGARGAMGATERWTGAGVLIANLDSHVDVFHPDLFFADAGWYDWIDVDGDGALTPGRDAIDLDRDGVADGDEIARVLRANPYNIYGHSTEPLTRPVFDPSVDWIYADTNGDGERAFGADEGFDDKTPAFGEPLFVPDDVDGDGRLGPQERLVRLGTSKLRALYVRVDWPGYPRYDRVFERGVDLAAAPGDVTGGVYGYSDTMHATAVLGILAGGVALPSRRWVGIAPDAELINAFDLSSTDSGRLLWALSHEPDVLLHEYVTWTGLPLDGTDSYSTIIADAEREGVANVCPAGNIGGARRHVARDVAADGEATLALQIPDDVRYIQVALHARGQGTFDAEIVDAEGTARRLTTAATDGVLAGGQVRYWAYGARSERDTQMRFVIIQPSGKTTLTFRVHAYGAPLTVHALSSDDRGFGEGAAWDGASDASTVAAPATADHCLAVGAVPSHLSSEGPWYGEHPEEAGQVRAYSARGPRIDGDLRPHVVAPDNPWAPLGVGDLYPAYFPGVYVAPHGAYQVFGGTSGAGPHAAGVAALLAQTGLEGNAILARIRETTIADPIAGALPNHDYGHGRLSAANALGGEAGGAAPTVRAWADPPYASPDEQVRLVVEVDDPDGDAVEIRWDDGYDGSWDTSYAAPEERSVSYSDEGVYRWRVRARDRSGRIADAAIRLVVTRDPLLPDGGMQPGGMTTEGGCGCGVPRTTGGLGLAPMLLAMAGALALRRRRRG